MFSKHSQRDSKIAEVEIEEALQAVSPQEPFFRTEPRLDYHHYEPILDPESEFPWHHPDARIKEAEINVPEMDMTQFHDPWDIYRGNIPPNTEDTPTHNIESQKAENHEEMRKYAWDYLSPPHHHRDVSYSSEQNIWQNEHSEPSQFENVEHRHHDFRGNVWEFNPEYNYNQEKPKSSQSVYQLTPNYEDREQHNDDKTMSENLNETQENIKEQNTKNLGYLEYSQNDNQLDFSHIANHQQTYISHGQNDYIPEFSFQKDVEKAHYPSHTHRVEYAYYVHLDHEKVQKDTENNEPEVESKLNGHGEADWEIFENLRPRHPYDGFYLRHQMTIDSRGRKVCTHEVPPTPTPPDSPIPVENWALQPSNEVENEQTVDNDDQTGVAGNFARMVLGVGAQQEALDDLTRRQGWEAGNIDYMGADAFDNIWAKISQTLSQPRSSPPKQSTPPPPPVDIPAPVEAVVETPVAQAPPEAPTPVTAPVPIEATTLVETPVPAEDSIELNTPVSVEEQATVKVIASIEAAKPPESLAPTELTKGVPTAEIDEPVKVSKPVETETAPNKTAIPAAVAEPTKVVAAAIPLEEPKPAAPAEAPVAAAPAATGSAVPVKSPAAVPTPTSKANDAAPVPKAVAAPAVASVGSAASPIKPDVLKTEITPEKGAATSDSPPLANTPSKEEVPIVPAAKSEERRKPAGELRLLPPAPAADTLPTPDSEQEDAAALAHAIIAGELRAPPAASPAPPSASPSPPATPTSPPAGAVSLSQIGVEPKGKPTTAARIESSVAAADAPKKRVVKKVLKKEGAPGEAPVPPPRKKEKKPKDK